MMTSDEFISFHLTKLIVSRVILLACSSGDQSPRAEDVTDIVNKVLEKQGIFTYQYNNDIGICIDYLNRVLPESSSEYTEETFQKMLAAADIQDQLHHITMLIAATLSNAQGRLLDLTADTDTLVERVEKRKTADVVLKRALQFEDLTVYRWAPVIDIANTYYSIVQNELYLYKNLVTSADISRLYSRLPFGGDITNQSPEVVTSLVEYFTKKNAENKILSDDVQIRVSVRMFTSVVTYKDIISQLIIYLNSGIDGDRCHGLVEASKIIVGMMQHLDAYLAEIDNTGLETVDVEVLRKNIALAKQQIGFIATTVHYFRMTYKDILIFFGRTLNEDGLATYLETKNTKEHLVNYIRYHAEDSDPSPWELIGAPVKKIASEYSWIDETVERRDLREAAKAVEDQRGATRHALRLTLMDLKHGETAVEEERWSSLVEITVNSVTDDRTNLQDIIMRFLIKTKCEGITVALYEEMIKILDLVNVTTWVCGSGDQRRITAMAMANLTLNFLKKFFRE